MQKSLSLFVNAAKKQAAILAAHLTLILIFLYQQNVNAQVEQSMGIITLGNKRIDVFVLADDAWVGGWHYSTNDRIAGTGDFDNDGQDDFIIMSDWGLGILTLKEASWRMIFTKPNGTSLGDWVLDSPKNKIQGVGDFNNDGKDDILITSDWGIGILTLDKKNRLKSLLAKPNSTRFGGWNFDSKDDTIHGIGDFNGDEKDDILITSDWGIGILTYERSLKPIIADENGINYGGWRFDSNSNTIQGIGDFDGDGRDDILVTSKDAMGILNFSQHLSMYEKMKTGTRFGDWLFDSRQNTIQGIGDFNGDRKADILITSDWGIGILIYNKNNHLLESIMTEQNGTLFGEWNFNSHFDSIRGIGDLDGDGYDDIIIQNGLCLGLLEWFNSSLRHIQIRSNGELFGKWFVEKTDRIVGIGNFDNSKGVDILIQKSKPYKVIEYFQPNIRFGGRAISIAVNPADEKQMIVASETGGLFKTTDGGITWRHLDNLPNFNVTDVKYLVSDPKIVIATAWADFMKKNNGCIWRSTDGGETWSQPPTAIPPSSERCGEKISAFSITLDKDKKRLYVGTDCGLAISDDLGETWRHEGLTQTDNSKIETRVWSVIAPYKNIVYLSADNGIWYSKNGGRSFRTPDTNLVSEKRAYHTLAASPFDKKIVFCVTSDEKLCYSVDGGRKWDGMHVIHGDGREAFVRTAKSISGNHNEFDLYYSNGLSAVPTFTKI